MLHYISSRFLSVSLGRYLYLWTISRGGYHPPCGQCFDTGQYGLLGYICYRN